ncbi:MAG: hypothetical protein UMV23_03130 [Halanaerobium sp.]|nr:hypothetical protein [Halanaerobium sp.]
MRIKTFTAAIMLLALLTAGIAHAAEGLPPIKTLKEFSQEEEVLFHSYSLPRMGPEQEPRYEDVEREALERGLQQAWDWFLQLTFSGQPLKEFLSPETRRSVFANFINSLEWQFLDRVSGGKNLELILKVGKGDFAQALNKVLYAVQFSEDIKSGFTGLIVDARGRNISRTMSPKIFSVTGEEIYGTMDKDYQYVLEVGLVEYFSSPTANGVSSRVGDNPLLVKAVGIRDGMHPVVSKEDAQKIALADNIDPFLRYCKVIILTD